MLYLGPSKKIHNLYHALGHDFPDVLWRECARLQSTTAKNQISFRIRFPSVSAER
jgi:hypothetical protein